MKKQRDNMTPPATVYRMGRRQRRVTLLLGLRKELKQKYSAVDGKRERHKERERERERQR